MKIIVFILSKVYFLILIIQIRVKLHFYIKKKKTVKSCLQKISNMMFTAEVDTNVVQIDRFIIKSDKCKSKTFDR
jgi:hypothetical protein